MKTALIAAFYFWLLSFVNMATRGEALATEQRLPRYYDPGR